LTTQCPRSRCGQPKPEDVAASLPPTSELIVSADNIKEAIKKGRELAQRLAAPGRIARLTYAPDNFKDWDDWLVETNPNDRELGEARQLIINGTKYQAAHQTGEVITMQELFGMDFPPRTCLLAPWLLGAGAR